MKHKFGIFRNVLSSSIKCFHFQELKTAFKKSICVKWWTDMFNPFPLTTNLQQTTLKTSRQKHRETLSHLQTHFDVCGKGFNEWTIIEYSWNHGDKRRNCFFWAISSFVAMFSKSRLLQRRQKGLSACVVYLSREAKGSFFFYPCICPLSTCTTY